MWDFNDYCVPVFASAFPFCHYLVVEFVGFDSYCVSLSLCYPCCLVLFLDSVVVGSGGRSAWEAVVAYFARVFPVIAVMFLGSAFSAGWACSIVCSLCEGVPPSLLFVWRVVVWEEGFGDQQWEVVASQGASEFVVGKGEEVRGSGFVGSVLPSSDLHSEF